MKIINREISWLSFNDRVLQEAADTNNPLIERLRFLGIFSNNLDEFFRVRVATVKRLILYDNKGDTLGPHLTPKKLLKQIQENVLVLQNKFQVIYNQIIKELEEKNIHIINEKQLSDEQGVYVKHFFTQQVYPTLVPIMLTNIKEFPYLKDKSIYLAVRLCNEGDSNTPFALIEVPSSNLSRFVVLPESDGNQYIILLDDVIRYCLPDVFATLNYENIESYTIKITRDAELDLDNDLSQSILEKMKKGLKRRKLGLPVRFVYDKDIHPDLFRYLTKKLKVGKEDNLIPGGRYHNFKDFIGFPNVGPKSLEFTPIVPVQHPKLKPYTSIMNTLEETDVLLHYPYQSFSYFIDLLREAAIDPYVKSIKLTAYRLAKKSTVVNALVNAAKNGKEVTVILELQARFDEENNIYWANILREEGVNVIYGLGHMKVHSKLCLITRKKGNKVSRYAKVATGNFNEKTARLYSDLGLYTAKPEITNEVEKVFQIFEKTYTTYVYKHLVLSPLHMRNRFIRLVNNEIRNAKKGLPAYIHLKLNSLVDEHIVHSLYNASKAGVKIRINVRGICSLIPGIEGLSDNIEVISILDKFLEHSRVYIFGNNGDELMYISSADLMRRNLDNRVEVTCPIYDPEIKKEINEFLEIQWRDNVKARILNEEMDNNYRKTDQNSNFRSQFELYDYYKSKLEN